MPVFLSEVPQLFDQGALALDAVLVNATPPDAHGFCSLGVSVEAMHAAIRAAKTVIVQFNRAMPRTLGESFIHVDSIDLAVEVEVSPYEQPIGSIGEVERQIGRYVAELVPDGATIQLGIGSIPAATALALVDHHDLGIHTEMFTDAVVDLVERGVVTGARKERNRGKIVAAFVMGSPATVRLRGRQPDGRDALGRLHQRHSRDPLVPGDDRDQLGHRGRSRAARSPPTRSAPGSTAESAARWTSSEGAALAQRGPGDHRPAIDRGRRDHLADQSAS